MKRDRAPIEWVYSPYLVSVDDGAAWLQADISKE